MGTPNTDTYPVLEVVGQPDQLVELVASTEPYAALDRALVWLEIQVQTERRPGDAIATLVLTPEQARGLAAELEGLARMHLGGRA